MLFIPRLFLAPLLSVVIIAFIASGESGYQINLQNLPAFLVFAFLMGFNSESLTRTIRDLFNRVFDDAKEDAMNAESRQKVEVVEEIESMTLIEKWEASARQKAGQLANDLVDEKFRGQEA